MNRMTCSLTAWFGIAIAAGTVAPVRAEGQLSCTEYGYQAVRQARQAEIDNCGLSGPRWSKDLAAHVEWCQSVSPAVWLEELKARTLELKKCNAKN